MIEVEGERDSEDEAIPRWAWSRSHRVLQARFVSEYGGKPLMV